MATALGLSLDDFMASTLSAETVQIPAETFASRSHVLPAQGEVDYRRLQYGESQLSGLQEVDPACISEHLPDPYSLMERRGNGIGKIKEMTIT